MLSPTRKIKPHTQQAPDKKTNAKDRARILKQLENPDVFEAVFTNSKKDTTTKALRSALEEEPLRSAEVFGDTFHPQNPQLIANFSKQLSKTANVPPEQVQQTLWSARQQQLKSQTSTTMTNNDVFSDDDSFKGLDLDDDHSSVASETLPLLDWLFSRRWW